MHIETAAVAEDLGDQAAAAIALVRAKAQDARFGAFAARRPSQGGKYIQVNRVDSNGHILAGGWTFLVDLAKQTVVRTVVTPESFDTKAAVRNGRFC
ncbi:hypothetical protein [Nocardia inohanensis]|uniref:hypothetical protein n=1 Tax=Nocardia inohanensis TaxID=209246 RepID=UPI00082F0E13|nr:hypothetical protein [Nocardia inohanensis]